MSSLPFGPERRSKSIAERRLTAPFLMVPRLMVPAPKVPTIRKEELAVQTPWYLHIFSSVPESSQWLGSQNDQQRPSMES
jgi:hypothetical protein